MQVAITHSVDKGIGPGGTDYNYVDYLFVDANGCVASARAYADNFEEVSIEVDGKVPAFAAGYLSERFKKVSVLGQAGFVPLDASWIEEGEQ